MNNKKKRKKKRNVFGGATRIRKMGRKLFE
jgi:hypothetical protein